MTPAPTPPAERYLDVARALGVSDAAIRRHHAVGADTPLVATLADDLSSPTDELVGLLAAAGVVLDLDAVDPSDDVPALALCLARFGFVAECAEVAGDLEIVATDVVADDVEHVRAEPAAEPLRSALEERVLDRAGVEAVELVDGRTLVADARALSVLRDRYGPRVEPFETPLLAADVELDERQTVAAAAAPAAADSGPGQAGEAAAIEGPSDGDVNEETFGEFLASAGDEEAAAVEGALAAGGPRVHTTEDEAADLDRAAADVGGGPRRTVSSTGIDEVFADLEDAAASATSGGSATPDDAGVAATDDDPFTKPMEATSAASEPCEPASGAAEPPVDAADSSAGAPDSPTDAADSSDDTADGDDGPFVGGGPTRTVSETSADDILQRVSGDADFEDIADEEGEADPDAVLDDAEDLPDLPGDPTDDGDVVAGATDSGEPDVSEDGSGAIEGAGTDVTADEVDVVAGDDADEIAGDDADAVAGDDLVVVEDDSTDAAAEAVADVVAGDEADLADGAARGPGSGDSADERTGDGAEAVDDGDEAIGDDGDEAIGDDGDEAIGGDGTEATDGDSSEVTDGDGSDAIDGGSGAIAGSGATDADDAGVSADGEAGDSRGADAADEFDSAEPVASSEARSSDDSETADATETPDVAVERGSRAGRPSTDGPLARSGGVSPSPSGDASADPGSPAAVDSSANDAVATGGDADDPDGDSASLLERVRSVFRR